MARTKHSRDHMTNGDETFLYRGQLPKQLAEDFINKHSRPKIICIKGGISSGKTRLAKEFVRKVQWAEDKEIYTFFVDSKHYSTVDELRNQILRILRDNVPGWKNHKFSETEFFSAFREGQNGLKRLYMIVIDNLDRVKDKDRSLMLSFIVDFVKQTDNVHLVLPSRRKMKFVKIPHMVLQHEMKPMDPSDAKELLEDASGINCKGLKEHADDIVQLVCKLPLALMIAGYEMNGDHTSLPYTPGEFVELLKDSTTLTLDLENAPEEDHLSDNLTDDARKYYDILEKIVFGVHEPELFDLNELHESMNDISTASIKFNILRILLDSSLYTIECTDDKNSSTSFASSPLLMKIFREVFCKICQDSFLKEINSALCEAVGDEKKLKSDQADDVRKAEMHLRKRQKESSCSPEEVRTLREDVVEKSKQFLEHVIDDVHKKKSFSEKAYDIIRKVEQSERVEHCQTHSGIQETNASPPSYQEATSLSPSSHTPQNPEAESCLSPTWPTLPSSTVTSVSMQVKVHREQPQNSRSSRDATELSRTNEPLSGPCKEPPKSPGKEDENKEETLSRFHTLSSADNTWQPTFPSACVSSGPSDLFIGDSKNLDHLGEHLQCTLSLCDSSASCDADDKEHLEVNPATQDSGSDTSYSHQSTLPDQQALIFHNGAEIKEKQKSLAKSKGSESHHGCQEVQNREGIESEFNWEKTQDDREDRTQNPVQETVSEGSPVQETGAGSATAIPSEAERQSLLGQRPSRPSSHYTVPGNTPPTCQASYIPREQFSNRGHHQNFGFVQPFRPADFNPYHPREVNSGWRQDYPPSGISTPTQSFEPRGPPYNEGFGQLAFRHDMHPPTSPSTPNPSFQSRGPPISSPSREHFYIYPLRTNGFEHYPDGNFSYQSHQQNAFGNQQNPEGPPPFPFCQGEPYHGVNGGQFGYQYHHQQQQMQHDRYNQVHNNSYHHFQNSQGHQQNSRGRHQGNQHHHQSYRGNQRGRGRGANKYHQR